MARLKTYDGRPPTDSDCLTGSDASAANETVNFNVGATKEHFSLTSPVQKINVGVTLSGSNTAYTHSGGNGVVVLVTNPNTTPTIDFPETRTFRDEVVVADRAIVGNRVKIISAYTDTPTATITYRDRNVAGTERENQSVSLPAGETAEAIYIGDGCWHIIVSNTDRT